MDGFNQEPDFCIDNNGVIHCVWVHVYNSNFSKIFYSISYDDGLTWTTSENISLNEGERLSKPHIVCDSENNLHLTYDYNVYNVGETHIFYKKYDGANWSEPFVVSENMPGSRANKLVIDNNDRIYCFWYRSINNGTTFYKYLENNTWSDYFIPYDNNDFMAFNNCAVDNNNNSSLDWNTWL
ncbi:MAG: sialidase family protein [Bacteroidota bacterium]|nr:sialidase family protein [Bacteroidota bacterium]